MQFVRGDLVTDQFLGGGRGLADGTADALQRCLHIFGVRRDVLVNGQESVLAIAFSFPLGHGGSRVATRAAFAALAGDRRGIYERLNSRIRSKTAIVAVAE